MEHFQMQHASTTALQKHIQMPSNISFGVYFRKALSN